MKLLVQFPVADLPIRLVRQNFWGEEILGAAEFLRRQNFGGDKIL